jgi:hypothetical protein
MVHTEGLWVSCANVLDYRLTPRETDRIQKKKGSGHDMPAKLADLELNILVSFYMNRPLYEVMERTSFLISFMCTTVKNND